ncbi:MAG TPA: hypothetical protein VI997_06560 [Candidatus Thermoplasmatota archaeon]|nr:hypothetical protein [Candidatus Thermoplasmatota archaeon]
MIDERKLYEDALRLTVNKSLDDVATLLRWVVEAPDVRIKVEHVRRAREVLASLEGELETLRREGSS